MRLCTLVRHAVVVLFMLLCDNTLLFTHLRAVGRPVERQLACFQGHVQILAAPHYLTVSPTSSCHNVEKLALLSFPTASGVNGLFHLCDTKGYLQQYKIPRTPAQALDPELLNRTLKQVSSSSSS